MLRPAETVIRAGGRRCGRHCVVLLLAAAATLLWSGCKGQDVPQATIRPGPPPARLVVITPHNQTIRRAFEQDFSDWHAEKYDQPVNIRWIARGTPQCLLHIQDAATNDEFALRGLVPDLMFGGGVTEHRVLAERGFARALTSLPEEEAIPASLLGVALVDDQGKWHTTALSSFGIFFHRQACAERGIPEPQSWADLADPAYYGWVAVADPTRSGSNRFCLDLMLQRYGWEEGWGLVLRMAANARTLLPSSQEVIGNVSAGMCLAGLSVNFAALQEAAAQPAGRLAFISPPGASAVTPDVITVLNYASAPQVAERFVRFCLSEQGQALWSLRGGPAGGSAGGSAGGAAEARGPHAAQALFRYPVVPEIYEKYAGRLAVTDNPFKQASEFTVDMNLERQQAKIVGPLLLAACGENHILLQRAWKTAIDRGLPADALAELTKPPFGEQEAYALGERFENSDQADGLSASWAAAFRAKYEKVIQLAGGSP